MKTIYYTASSLDGFIANRDNGLEWLFQFGEQPEGDFATFLNDVGAIAMGSNTYEWILTHHVLPGADHPQPWAYFQPVWVFTSRSLPVVPGADVRFVSGDVKPFHDAMRAAACEKNIWIMGGGELAGQFHDHGLLDEVIVSVASVTLGAGAPLLPRTIVTPPLRLLSVTQYGEAFAELRYAVHGAK
jgi:dihydrofolate reductase